MRFQYNAISIQCIITAMFGWTQNFFQGKTQLYISFPLFGSLDETLERNNWMQKKRGGSMEEGED